MGINNRL